MPDFVPDDMDAYVAHAKHVEELVAISEAEGVEDAATKMGEWAVTTAHLMMKTGYVEPGEALAAVVATCAGVMAEWLRLVSEEDENGQAGD
jgi:hypothetical protein